MEPLMELEYTPEDNFICPIADTENCGGKNNCTYKTRKGLVDHIRRKHMSTVIWICSQCTFKGTWRFI